MLKPLKPLQIEYFKLSLVLTAPIAYWILGLTFFPYQTHDSLYWASYLHIPVYSIYLIIGVLNYVSGLVILTTFRSMKAFLVFMLPPFSIWMIQEGLLRQAIGIMFTVFYAESLQKHLKSSEHILWLLLSLTHPLSGVLTLTWSLTKRSLKDTWLIIWVMIILLATGLFAYDQQILLNFNNLPLIDIFSLTTRVIMTSIVFLAIYIGDKNL